MKLDVNLEKAFRHCYRELYANATPPASFDVLAKENKENFFMDHSIEKNLYDEIIEDTIDLYKIKHKIYKNAFKTAIASGASPRIKK
jgi:hypothetical protein